VTTLTYPVTLAPASSAPQPTTLAQANPAHPALNLNRMFASVTIPANSGGGGGSSTPKYYWS
jgi:hypothetical protein